MLVDPKSSILLELVTCGIFWTSLLNVSLTCMYHLRRDCIVDSILTSIRRGECLLAIGKKLNCASLIVPCSVWKSTGILN